MLDYGQQRGSPSDCSPIMSPGCTWGRVAAQTLSGVYLTKILYAKGLKNIKGKDKSCLSLNKQLSPNSLQVAAALQRDHCAGIISQGTKNVNKIVWYC